MLSQGNRYKFGSEGAVCFIEESSEPPNPWVPIVLRTSKSAGAKGNFSNFDVAKY